MVVDSPIGGENHHLQNMLSGFHRRGVRKEFLAPLNSRSTTRWCSTSISCSGAKLPAASRVLSNNVIFSLRLMFPLDSCFSGNQTPAHFFTSDRFAGVKGKDRQSGITHRPCNQIAMDRRSLRVARSEESFTKMDLPTLPLRQSHLIGEDHPVGSPQVARLRLLPIATEEAIYYFLLPAHLLSPPWIPP